MPDTALPESVVLLDTNILLAAVIAPERLPEGVQVARKPWGDDRAQPRGRAPGSNGGLGGRALEGGYIVYLVLRAIIRL